MDKQLTQKQQNPVNQLALNDINKKVVKAEYAVRGIVPSQAAKIKQQLQQNTHSFPFSELTECNVGDPQSFGQQPISFNRDVLSGILNPKLINSSVFSKDVQDRVNYYIKNMGSSTVGSYSDNGGYIFIREAISRFISKRDNNPVQTDPNDIILTNGASQGVFICMKTLISDSRDGVMIPVPQYPYYSASCSLFSASEIHYFLAEKQGWSVSKEELQKQFKEAKMRGINPKILVVINPGNPTGQVMSYDQIKKMIEFASENNLVVFADEVYQENIYTSKKKFVSFKKVRSEMPFPYNQLQLFSFHSTSKGLLGECGLRGGYFEMCGIDQKVKEQVMKMSILLISNSVGQFTTELMCNPPTLDNASQETVDQYNHERNSLLESLKSRAQLVTQSLNQMTHISCQEIEGAMYAFPRIEFSKKVLEEAAKNQMEPDLFYCLKVLENTGIVLVPGSGFKQEENTYHFRMTTLIQDQERLKESLKALSNFNQQFHEEYK